MKKAEPTHDTEHHVSVPSFFLKTQGLLLCPTVGGS